MKKIISASFLDGLTGAGLFGKLRRPFAPTELIDTRTLDEFEASGELKANEAGGPFKPPFGLSGAALEHWRKLRLTRFSGTSSVRFADTSSNNSGRPSRPEGDNVSLSGFLESFQSPWHRNLPHSSQGTA